MPDEDFQPLSLGEILDRSFSLYRRNVRLFAGISVIPHLFALALALLEIWLFTIPFENARRLKSLAAMRAANHFGVEVGIFVLELFVSYLLIQAPTTLAVSELYVGRAMTPGGALRRVLPRIGALLRCELLTGLVLIVSYVALVVPGLYLSCRLLVALPAATIEKLGAGQAYRRSMALTKSNAGRAFVIFLLYFLLRLMVAAALFYPERLMIALSLSHPRLSWPAHTLLELVAVTSATVLAPILAIAASVFYFDLRVRREALDLQVMMNPETVAG